MYSYLSVYFLLNSKEVTAEMPPAEKRLSPIPEVVDKTDNEIEKRSESPIDVTSDGPELTEAESVQSKIQTLLDASALLSLREIVKNTPIPKKDRKSTETEILKSPEPQPAPREERPSFLFEHDYFAQPPVTPKKDRKTEDGDTDGTVSAEENEYTTPYEVFMDHNYCLPPKPEPVVKPQENIPVKSIKKDLIDDFSDFIKPSENLVEKKQKEPPKRKRKTKNAPLSDITPDTLNRDKVSRELINLLPTPKPPIKFNPRKFQEERKVFFDIYNQGIDLEDISFLKQTYENLLQSEEPMFYWINDILWVDHPFTNIPDPVQPRKKRKLDQDTFQHSHKTGKLFSKIRTTYSQLWLLRS